MGLRVFTWVYLDLPGYSDVLRADLQRAAVDSIFGDGHQDRHPYQAAGARPLFFRIGGCRKNWGENSILQWYSGLTRA
eukprot:1180373-Prorocentrum_minimum.AAC.2